MSPRQRPRTPASVEVAAPAAPVVGSTVRYCEPSTRRMRVGRVERVVRRGAEKGSLVVRASGLDHRRSTVRPEAVTALEGAS